MLTSRKTLLAAALMAGAALGGIDTADTDSAVRHARRLGRTTGLSPSQVKAKRKNRTRNKIVRQSRVKNRK